MMSMLDKVVVQILPHVPRSVVRRVSSRYIAGSTLADALRVVRQLNSTGARATVDLLGEFVHELSEAEGTTRQYLELIAALQRERLDSQVSVKLTALGLKLDPEASQVNLMRLVHAAAGIGSLVTIDMEDSSCTDAALDAFERARKQSASVGAVLQACLRRSRADLERLLPLIPNVRICKGIYIEPPEIAYQDRDEVRQSFLDLVDAMLSRPSFVGIATHDDHLIEGSLELLKRHESRPEHYEFQMLLGVREGLRARLLAGGHPVRVYVPYGDSWYAYSLRRLQENPAIAGHVLRGLLDRHR
jgi:proline dehydrogenase